MLNLYLTVMVSSVTVTEGDDRSAPTFDHEIMSPRPAPEHLMEALPPCAIVWSGGDMVTVTEGHTGLAADGGLNREMGPSLCSWYPGSGY